MAPWPRSWLRTPRPASRARCGRCRWPRCTWPWPTPGKTSETPTASSTHSRYRLDSSQYLLLLLLFFNFNLLFFLLKLPTTAQVCLFWILPRLRLVHNFSSPPQACLESEQRNGTDSEDAFESFSADPSVRRRLGLALLKLRRFKESGKESRSRSSLPGADGEDALEVWSALFYFVLFSQISSSFVLFDLMSFVWIPSVG
jgi:hypothetical protein